MVQKQDPAEPFVAALYYVSANSRREKVRELLLLSQVTFLCHNMLRLCFGNSSSQGKVLSSVDFIILQE